MASAAAVHANGVFVKQVSSGFAYVALWQAMVFVIMLLLVWVNEVLDLSYVIFGTPRQSFSIFRGCLASSGVLIGGIVAIGNTYAQQRRIVSGLLTICSYCKKIRMNENLWQRVEEYIGKHSVAALTHGICPDCFVNIKQQIDAGINDEVSGLKS